MPLNLIRESRGSRRKTYKLNVLNRKPYLALQSRRQKEAGPHSLHEYSKKTISWRVLITNEVDGVASNEDGGIINELTKKTKRSHILINCMCIDRNLQKK